ncbi:entericidin A/B family lipoprotein [Pseudogemmobacter sonorensis]
MKRLLIVLGFTGLAACQTIEGAGRDMQSAGQAVSEEAQRVQSDL